MLAFLNRSRQFSWLSIVVKTLFLFCIEAFPTIWVVASGSEYTTLAPRLLLSYSMAIISFICISEVLVEYIGAHTLFLADAIDFLLHFIIICSSCISCFLWYNFHSSITYSIVLLILGTNSSESAEFFCTYLDKFTIVVFLSYAAFVFIEYLFVKKDRTRQSNHNKLIILPIILSLFTIMVYNLRFFSGTSVENIDQISNKRSYFRYDPLHNVYNSLLQVKEHRLDLETCYSSCDNVSIDSCSFYSPNIVLIVGESHIKSHSNLYGYNKITNPRLSQRDLFVFDDVVSPVNNTSKAFISMFSTDLLDTLDLWCKSPLLPAILKKSGYNVVFYSNGFNRLGTNNPYDAIAGFLIDGKVSSKLFTYQNTQTYLFDHQLLDDYDEHRQIVEKEDNNFVVFQLRGQHVDAGQRFTKEYKCFNADDYSNRNHLTDYEKQQVANYDNACLYNDYIIDRIIEMYSDKESIVIYLSDHGDEVNDYRSHVGRDYQLIRDADYLHCQFDVPFFVYLSDSYIINHPSMVDALNYARSKPLSSNRLSHLVLWLAGVSSPVYNDELNVLSEAYDTLRPRLIYNWIDYDEVVLNNQHNLPYYGIE